MSAAAGSRASKRMSTATLTDRILRYRWCLLVVLAAVYAASLPHTVQHLDSGEMVTSAYGLTVPHAPGYPIYVWLYHALIAVLHVGSVFFRAALITAACSVGAAALLLALCRNTLGVTAIAAMATLPAVWRYAVLPDVFGLNQLFAAALVFVAFSPPRPARVFLGAIVFGLAAANHQSIIFLSPMLMLIAWQEPKRGRALAALALGAGITVALYVSLFLLDVHHVNSWGDLVDFKGLLRHFLRGDYGTFKLSSYGGDAHIGSVVRDFAMTVGPFGLAAAAVVGLGAAEDVKARAHGAWWVLLACFIAYAVLFIPRMNFGGDSSSAITLRERFFVLPSLMLAALVVTAPSTRAKDWARNALASVLGLVAVVQIVTGDTYDFRRDVVVEEYMRNLLRTAIAQRTPAILFVDSDTKLFAGRYLRATEPELDEVFILPRSMTYDRRLLERAKLRWPQLQYDAEVLRTRKKMDIFSQLIAPNMGVFSITHVMPHPSPRAKTIFFPVGRGLEAGSGVVIADVEPVNPRPPVYRANSPEYVDTKEIFSEYAVYYLAKGKDLLARGDEEGARQAFLDGLERVPYCIPCLKNLCAIDDNRDERCGQALRDLEATEYDYFE